MLSIPVYLLDDQPFRLLGLKNEKYWLDKEHIMKQEMFRRFFGRSLFQSLGVNEVLVLDVGLNLWLEHGPFGTVPPTREQVDGNAVAFGAINANTIYVLGSDGNLWLEHGPFGTVPPTRQQVDGNVAAFDTLFENIDAAILVYVLGSDGNLWLEHGPFGAVPPTRQQVDGNVAAFDSIDASNIYVLGSDGKLWLEFGQSSGLFGPVPPPRQQVDGNVAAFAKIDESNIYVLGSDGKLWLEHGPFGTVPPTRQQVDGNVAAFDAIDSNAIYVLGSDRNLWLEHGPFGTVPPTRQQVDVTVVAFDKIDENNIYVLGVDGNLWLEHAPFGTVPPARQLVDRLILQAYRFSLDSFQILNTRSGNIFSTSKDTDYVSFGLTVNNNPTQVITQSMGDLSNGTFPTNLVFDRVISDSDNVVLTYQITNNSVGEANATAYLRQAALLLANAAVKAIAAVAAPVIGAEIGSLIGIAIPVPLVGSALGALGGWLLGSAWGITFPDCDGPVAAGVHIFTGASLRAMTANNQTFTTTENHPGVDSPSGCGSNSNYDVTWSVSVG